MIGWGKRDSPPWSPAEDAAESNEVDVGDET
jgi:hypothetical protein